MKTIAANLATPEDRKTNSIAGLLYLMLVAAFVLAIAVSGGLLNSL